MSKTIYCPIHGYITLSPIAMKIINTPEMQRLREIKQLGASYLVYPSATHTRFEHSIGVAYLARKMGERLREVHPELAIKSKFIDLLEIAGLIHDIGHGPFSHLYDHYVRHVTEPEHEVRGIQLFKYLVKRENLDLSKEEVDDVIKMINPVGNDIYLWKYQIVANKLNQIDVDKIDYILRDSRHLGIPHAGEFTRLINDVRIAQIKEKTQSGINSINNLSLVWDEKLEFDIYSLFATRYKLHKKVYTHHTVKGFEYILIDILRKIKMENPTMNLAMATDSVVTQYIYTHKKCPLAQKIFRRRQPKLIGEMVISASNETKYNTNNDIDEFSNKYRTVIDLVIEKIKIGFVSGDGENPLKKVYYYSSKDEQKKAFKKNIGESTFIIPERFQENIVRLYTKNSKIKRDDQIYWNELTKQYR